MQLALKIVDLNPERYDESISLCIGCKPGFEQAREEKRRWLESHYPEKVGGKLAYLNGQIAGMIEFCPIEHSPFPVTGEGLLHINCIWVLPGYQRKSIGQTLLRSCKEEMQTRGRRGLSVLAHDGPIFMPAAFFAHEGFQTIQKRLHTELMWKEIEPCRPPEFLESRFTPEKLDDGIAIDMLWSAQCPWSIMTRHRIQRVSREFREQVRFRSIQADDRQSINRLGESKKIFVNGKETFIAPPTEGDIRRTIEVEARELNERTRSKGLRSQNDSPNLMLIAQSADR